MGSAGQNQVHDRLCALAHRCTKLYRLTSDWQLAFQGDRPSVLILRVVRVGLNCKNGACAVTGGGTGAVFSLLSASAVDHS